MFFTICHDICFLKGIEVRQIRWIQIRRHLGYSGQIQQRLIVITSLRQQFHLAEQPSSDISRCIIWIKTSFLLLLPLFNLLKHTVILNFFLLCFVAQYSQSTADFD